MEIMVYNYTVLQHQRIEMNWHILQLIVINLYKLKGSALYNNSENMKK